ncbi:MAG: response regulator [Maribacter sp.]|nr:response regulator [Maribacter sp.]
MSKLKGMIEIKKQEYDKLIEERERFKLVLEGTRLGMWDWNPLTNEVVFDEQWCAMLGYKFGEIKNELNEWSSRVHPDDIEQCFKDIQNHIEGKIEFYENIHRMKHKNGKWLYILDRGRIMKRDSNGNVIRFTGTHTDITREKEATIKAIQSKKSKELFFSMMSHELRTPLTSIIAAFSLFENKKNKYKGISNLLDITKYSLEHLKHLIDNLLDYQKFDMFSIELNLSPDLINKVLQDIQTSFEGEIEILGLKMSVNNTLANNAYQIDKIRLSQILINLVSNSTKYTERGGHIEISACDNTTNKKGSILFCVKDDGRGIDKKHFSKIFQPFEQATTEDQVMGTGLGLALNKRLIELMGGEIWLESELDKGTSFYFTVQAKEITDNNLKDKEPEQIDFNDFDYSKLKILVAEDDIFIRMVYKAMFENNGITNYELAVDGEEALEKFHQGNFNLLLSDWYMPKLDGCGLVSQIRHSNKQIKIIGCSANVSNADKDKFYEAGIDYLLQKPFDLDNLNLILAKVLEDM